MYPDEDPFFNSNANKESIGNIFIACIPIVVLLIFLCMCGLGSDKAHQDPGSANPNGYHDCELEGCNYAGREIEHLR